jgi:hypothetical protein
MNPKTLFPHRLPGGITLLAASLIILGLGFSEVAVFLAGVGLAAFHV